MLMLSCKQDETIPTVSVTFGNNISSGWYGDTIKMSVDVQCENDFSVTITNNHDTQKHEQTYSAGSTTVKFNYLIPTTLSNGDKVKVTVIVKDTETDLTETVEVEIGITNANIHKTIYHQGVISADETWLAADNHIVKGSLIISGCEVTIEPGTVVKVKDGYSIKITGQNTKLTAIGTDEKIITFTSFSETPAPGAWGGLQFTTGINNTTTMKYCKIEYAGSNDSYGTVYINDATLSIENTEISNSKTYGIVANDNGFVSFQDNTIKNCSNPAIKISPNQTHTIGLNNQISPELGIEITGGTFMQNAATWLKQTTPYIISNDLFIKGANNPTLTIAKGSILKIKTGVKIEIGATANYGTLIAIGGETEQIIFTSFSITPQMGDWSYIMFKEGATNCILEYCQIEYGGSNSSYGMIDLQNNAILKIKNCTLSNSKNFAVETEDSNGFAEFTNNTINGTTGHLMKIKGTYVHTIGTGNSFNVTENTGVLVTGAAESYNYVKADATWKALSCAYYIEDPIIVRNNATLTIEAGAKLKFNAGEYLQIGHSSEHGKLVAIGTADARIEFTSSSPTPQKGDWRGIYFSTFTLNQSIIDYAVISYGGSSSSYQGNIAVDPSGAGNPTIQNCEIHNSKYYGIVKKEVSNQIGNPTLINNTYHDNNSGDTN